MHTFLDERDRLEIDNRIKKASSKSIVVGKAGSVVNVTDGANDLLKGLRVFGKTEQNTVPGNQLLPNFRHETVTENGITFTNHGDGTYSLNGKATNYTQFIDIASFVLSAGTHTMSGVDAYTYTQLRSVDGTTVIHSGNGSFTLDEETEVKFRQTIAANVVYENKRFYPMLNKGSTALPYEPYTEGIPSPNPEYPQELVSVGWDGNVEVGVYGGNLASSFYYSEDASPYTKILYAHADLKPSTIYTISFVGVKGNHFYGNEHMFSDYPVLECTGGRQFITVKTLDTLDKTASIYNNVYGWILFKNHSSNTVVPLFTDVQIELGTTATPYKPYTKQPLVIPTPNGLPGIKVTDSSLATYTDENGQMLCSDEVDFERRVYIQRVGVYNIRIDSSNITYASPYCSINKSVIANIDNRKNSLSTHFIYKQDTSGNSKGVFWIDSSGTGLRFVVDGCDTLDKYIQFFTDNDVKIYYPLATPIETPLSEEEIAQYKALHTNYPNTTILNDSNAHMEVKYTADIQNHIEQNYVSKEDAETLLSRVSNIEKNMV